ncbi:MAG: type 1 glutamine amidotransferase [Pseudomonadota bacterium]
MNALILQHYTSEGPGTIGSYLSSRGIGINIIRLCDGDRIPSNALEHDAIISMGGPMNVYEEDLYPFLRDETFLLKKAMGMKIPILGVCLGAQMIAKAAGARVVKSPKKEVGWHDVELTTLGRADRLLIGLPDNITVFQWHGDMFEIPVGGALLATSGSCPHQALKFGSAYGLQFHVEVTSQMLEEWFEKDHRKNQFLGEMEKIQRQFKSCANIMFGNFFKMITHYHQTHVASHGGHCC